MEDLRQHTCLLPSEAVQKLQGMRRELPLGHHTLEEPDRPSLTAAGAEWNLTDCNLAAADRMQSEFVFFVMEEGP